jgi:hypothetical protein
LLPNFLIAGTPKSGTTSLYYYLRQHPDVFMPSVKEPHYFSNPNFNDPSFRKFYEGYFDSAGNNKAIGEASVGYLYYPEAARRIKKFIPDCRLIFLFRDPIDRAYSHYWHQVRNGVEKLSFEDAVAQEEERIKKYGGTHWMYRYVTLGRYADFLLCYLDLFDRDHLLFLTFEDLKKRPLETFRQVIDFLGLDEWLKVDLTPKNLAGKPKSQILMDAIWGRNSLARPFKGILPKRIKQWGRAKIAEINVKPEKYPPMRPETEKELGHTFRPYNEQLETLTELSLSSSWKSYE